MADPKTPIFRTTTAALDKADPALEVSVLVGDKPVRFIRVTPSKAPDPGLLHTVGVNEATPVLDVPTLPGAVAPFTPLAVEFTNLPVDRYAVVSVFINAGADGTTFDVVAIR